MDGFSEFLIINRVLTLAILVINRVWFLHSSLELEMLWRRSYDKTIKRSPS